MDKEIRSCNKCQIMACAIDEFYSFMDATFSSTAPYGGSRDELLPYWRSALDKGVYKKVILGPFEELENRNDCTSCQDIVRKLVKDSQRPPSGSILCFESGAQGLWIGPQDSKGYWLGSTRIFHLLPSVTSSPPYEVGRPFDTQQIDIGLVRQWISSCQISHGDYCLSSSLPLPPHLIYLIDAEESCLVLASAESRYIALSYVWGGTPAVKTVKSNLNDLRRPGSITTDAGNLAIPKTIRDAIRLTLLLGERYLWVDCFCIVQDDQDARKLFINSMASIYANAYFTIVAAAGNHADYGLRGIGGGAEARNVTRDVIQFQNGKEMYIFVDEICNLEKSSWGSRGWTFQENLFSRRTLVFNHFALWFCRRCVWREDISKPSEAVTYGAIRGPSAFRKSMVTQNASWPDLNEWADHVEVFNKRKFTYDEDVFDAFSGVTPAFSSRFYGGILRGIPELFFDHCIVWKHLGPLRRRQAHQNHKNTIPSWSWAGWEGEICLVGAPIILTNKPWLDDQSLRIVPTVRWYKSRNLSSDIIPVRNIYHHLQHAVLNKRSKKLPKGWTCDLYPDGTPYYVHNTILSVRFRCPIPLLNKDIDTSFNDQAQYLFFRGQRAWLFLGRDIPPPSEDWKICATCLVDSSGNWAGSIRLNSSNSGGPPLGKPCELVALSFGTVRNSGDYLGVLDEWLLPERPRDSNLYCFYYVMWIEWENGIAYRKSIGTVHQPVWEREIKDSIDVVLG